MPHSPCRRRPLPHWETALKGTRQHAHGRSPGEGAQIVACAEVATRGPPVARGSERRWSEPHRRRVVAQARPACAVHSFLHAATRTTSTLRLRTRSARRPRRGRRGRKGSQGTPEKPLRACCGEPGDHDRATRPDAGAAAHQAAVSRGCSQPGKTRTAGWQRSARVAVMHRGGHSQPSMPSVASRWRKPSRRKARRQPFFPPGRTTPHATPAGLLWVGKPFVATVAPKTSLAKAEILTLARCLPDPMSWLMAPAILWFSFPGRRVRSAYFIRHAEP